MWDSWLLALAKFNPYKNFVAEAHHNKINEHPRFVVRVVPHPNTKSGHLEPYDILDSKTSKMVK